MTKTMDHIKKNWATTPRVTVKTSPEGAAAVNRKKLKYKKITHGNQLNAFPEDFKRTKIKRTDKYYPPYH